MDNVFIKLYYIHDVLDNVIIDEALLSLNLRVDVCLWQIIRELAWTLILHVLDLALISKQILYWLSIIILLDLVNFLNRLMAMLKCFFTLIFFSIIQVLKDK